MNNILFLVLMIFKFSDDVQGEKILAIIPSPFYSHQATFRPLWRELSRRGHEITLITTDLMEENENITQIDYSKTYEILEKHQFKEFFVKGYSVSDIFVKVFEIMDDLMDYQLTHPDLVRLIKNRKKFDLLMVEMLMPHFPILSVTFDCPFIGLTTMDALPHVHEMIGNAMHPAIYPFADFGFQQPMSFWERLMSTTYISVTYLMKTLIFQSLLSKYLEKYIAKDLPDLDEVQKNASLLFYNANPLFFPVRPINPISVNLGGGLHLTDPQDLPKDIQTYLDEAKDGCIYFSFGSTVNSNYLSQETLEIFRKTFQELAPLKVLWKFENDTMPNKPENVHLRKWLPQQDILRHPNVKAFITQGGLQSMEEAIDSAVPMLGMPFYGDQINNVKKMVDKGFGLKLEVKTMDSNSLKNSILELLNNPKYKKNIDRLSAISKDQPMRPLEKAVWWIEYVLRHKTTEHLRSPSADIPLYQYFFLDILAFS
ncbi:hypothetical protein WA026_017156 [Henosepilachna vigintioctopunctata]|uniref:UDP-glucuronosyltransferase n=1 Tax=Henosepilachna vigintioctopunctata TaxID=420089 RepID=A0AAW1ULG8_9CUCU